MEVGTNIRRASTGPGATAPVLMPSRPAALVTAADLHHPDVGYWRPDGVSFEMFRCTTWRASLSMAACARRWEDAQVAKGERAEELRLCRQCHFGARHAGRPSIIERAQNFGSNVCVRCERGSGRRLVGKTLCISCYNRQQEWIRGANGKGSKPVKAVEALAYWTIGVVLDPGAPDERTAEFTNIAVNVEELKRAIGQVHSGGIDYLGAVERGTFPAWRPNGLGGEAGIIIPPPGAKVGRPAPKPPMRCSSHVVHLRRMALASTYLRPVPVVRRTGRDVHATLPAALAALAA